MLASVDRLLADSAWTRGWFRARLPRLSDAALKDTASFTERSLGTLRECGPCGSVFRDGTDGDPIAAYRGDTYDPRLVRTLRASFLSGYQRDPWLTSHGLRPGARVLEIGSYVGGFLELCRRQGWEAVGIDAGHQLAERCRAVGLAVIAEPFDPERVPGPFDAVWVLNCFEQLPTTPAESLSGIADVLRPGGLLVVRTPSADFVRAAYSLAPASLGRLLLAGTNLAAVPYRKCLSLRALLSTLQGAGFSIGSIRGRAPRSLAAAAFDGTYLEAAHRRALLYAAPVLSHPWVDVAARLTSTAAAFDHPSLDPRTGALVHAC